MYFDNQRYRRTRQPATEERGGADERVRGHDHLRPEVVNLAADPERQPDVERGAVEHARPCRRAQPEALALRPSAVLCRAKNSVVDDPLDGIPLLRQPGREGEPVAAPA